MRAATLTWWQLLHAAVQRARAGHSAKAGRDPAWRGTPRRALAGVLLTCVNTYSMRLALLDSIVEPHVHAFFIPQYTCLNESRLDMDSRFHFAHSGQTELCVEARAGVP